MNTSPIEVLAPSDTTTLVRGTTVSMSSRQGAIRPGALLGVFYRDERLVSSVAVLIDGVDPPMLASDRTGASSDRVASLAALDEYRNAQALLIRRRTVNDGTVTEHIELHSFGPTKTVEVLVLLESDAASILHLRSGRPPGPALAWTIGEGLRATSHRDAKPFATVVVDNSASLAVNGSSLEITWKAEIETGRVWTASWTVFAAARVETPTSTTPDTRVDDLDFTVDGSDQRWQPAIKSSIADLHALTTEIPERGLRFVGAGAPWFLALFGRDSLITGWESLPLGTDLALDILDSVASVQGTEHVERTRQAPGKILHEWRVGAPQVFGMESGQIYYGSVDASPLFVMLLAEAYRWGAPVERIRRLLPAARAAVQWCRNDAMTVGGVNRGPFVWYTPDGKGLGNQGWKDSGDCMVHADGSLAIGSLAVAEAQAYVYEALMGMARLERDLGEGAVAAAALEADARHLSESFVEHFWVEDDGLIALALDEAGAPLCVATSNMGQCLWSGIVPAHLAARVAERTIATDLRTPWGIRTLGADEKAYNPLGYHLGTVWAHDTAIIAAGLARHGHDSGFRALKDGLLSAAEQFDWRLPELYGGMDTTVDDSPLPYPAACSPQAWSAGAPLLLLRAALGLDPDVPAGTVRIRPALDAGEVLTARGIRLGSQSGEISVDADGVVTSRGFTGLVVLSGD